MPMTRAPDIIGAFAIGAISAIGIREAVVRFLLPWARQSDVDRRKADACAVIDQNPDGKNFKETLQGWNPARVVSPPHPDWQPGQPQPCPLPGASDFIAVDCATSSPAALYPLTISAVVPRPVAFISSVDGSGKVNLSPYSFFNAMGFNPPTVAIGFCHSPARDEGKKDSLHNIEETGEFVVNIMSEWFVEAANHTCGDYPRGTDEMALAGLHPLPSTKVRPPRVAESAVHMECRLLHVQRVTNDAGAVTTSIAIGQVLAFHVSSAVAAASPSGKLTVDLARLAPVARCGGVTYGRVAELYDMARPDGQGRYPTGPGRAAA